MIPNSQFQKFLSGTVYTLTITDRSSNPWTTSYTPISMWVTDVVVTSMKSWWPIWSFSHHYPLSECNISPGTNILKMSPTPWFCDEHPEICTNFLSPTSPQHIFVVYGHQFFLAPALRIEISFALAQPSPIPIEFGFGQTVVRIVVMTVVSDNGFSTWMFF